MFLSAISKPFVPPEEGAKPGIVLGLEAGISEEVIFRLIITPFTFWLFSKVINFQISKIITILVSGVLFALAHEIGPGEGPDYFEFFFTRCVAGSLMSIPFFWPGPSFIISFHCTAHLILPFLFK